MPVALVLMASVDVPEPPEVKEMLVGFGAAVTPLVGDIVSLNASVPMKPLTLARVIVDEPEAPTGILILTGFAAIVKSVTFTITVAECTREPEVPVTMIVYVPAVAELAVRDEVAIVPLVTTTLVGDSDAVRPDGVTDVVSEIVPLKVNRLVNVIVDAADDPDCNVRIVGFADMLKLGGPGGLSLADLISVGAAVPSTYSKSSVSPVPVGRRVSP